MTVIVAAKLSGQSFKEIQKGSNNSWIALLITVVFAVWIGQRPFHPIFGDSYYYAYTFDMMKIDYFTDNEGAGSSDK
ncbi:MAG: hypothetical protein K2H03_01440, partial [Muribaculaceae bacterium]|nr:hypothetical protein [Muribaculaceae bacterium]